MSNPTDPQYLRKQAAAPTFGQHNESHASMALSAAADEIERLQSERDRETKRAMHWQSDYSRAIVDRKAVEAELAAVRAEVTAAKADDEGRAKRAVEVWYSHSPNDPEWANPVHRMSAAIRAADTRAELK